MRTLVLLMAILLCSCATQQTQDKYYSKGIEQQTNSDFTGAIENYTKAIKIQPDHAKAYVARGQCKFKLGDFPGSVTDADSAIKINPDLSEAFRIRGDAKYELGKTYGGYMDRAQALILEAKEKGEVLQSAYIDPTAGQDNLYFVRYSDRRGFTFDIPEHCENMTGNDLGMAIRKINPAIDFLAKVGLPSGYHLFSVASYDMDEEIHIDTAFAETVKYVATLMGASADEYKVEDYGVKKVDNKILRYKVSSLRDTDLNIMYYFMQDDYSRYYYEMKLSGSSPDDFKAAIDFIESVALSAHFKDN